MTQTTDNYHPDAITVDQERDPWVRVPIWLVERGSPSAVRVYAGLAIYAGLPDGSRPPLPLLAQRLTLSDRTVQRAIGELEELGAVRVERRYTDESRRVQLPSRYHLAITDPRTKLSPPPGDTNVTTPVTPVSPDIDRSELDRKTPEPAPTTNLSADKFGEFWSVYPRRDGRKPARDKFTRLVEREKVDPDVIVAGAARYAAYCRSVGRSVEHIALPVTWLNQARWEDELHTATPRAHQAAEWFR